MTHEEKTTDASATAEASEALPTLRRAFHLTLEAGTDTREDLAAALEQLAWEVRADKLTRGAWGSPSSGGTYELRVDLSMTHERYIEGLRARGYNA